MPGADQKPVGEGLTPQEGVVPAVEAPPVETSFQPDGGYVPPSVAPAVEAAPDLTEAQADVAGAPVVVTPPVAPPSEGGPQVLGNPAGIVEGSQLGDHGPLEDLVGSPPPEVGPDQAQAISADQPPLPGAEVIPAAEAVPPVPEYTEPPFDPSKQPILPGAEVPVENSSIMPPAVVPPPTAEPTPAVVPAAPSEMPVESAAIPEPVVGAEVVPEEEERPYKDLDWPQLERKIAETQALLDSLDRQLDKASDSYQAGSRTAYGEMERLRVDIDGATVVKAQLNFEKSKRLAETGAEAEKGTGEI